MTPEEKKAYIKKYKEEHREEINAKRREYYRTHKEQHKLYSKRWNEKNKDKIKERQHRYYLKNKDKIHQLNIEWIKNNKRKFVESISNSRRRRVERLKSEGVINAWGVVNKGEEPRYLKND